MIVKEPGTLNMKQVDELHEKLMKESALYSYCFENNLLGLVIRLQLKELENSNE